MSKSKSEPEAKPGKKGKGMIVKIAAITGLLTTGGGGVFGLMAAGVIGGDHVETGDNVPQLVKKGEDDPFAADAGKGDKDAAAFVYGEGGSQYRTAYCTFEEAFTSNLYDSDALLQVTIAVSTRRDGRVLMWLKQHDIAIRSAMLVVLADTPEADVLTPKGKQRLQKRLADAINRVLVEAEGFGGVDRVHFRTFIVQ